MHDGWGRIINVTTSLGTMLNAGYPTHGPSKAALKALSAIIAKDLDGTGVTVNVLVPGGITNTPMVPEAGFNPLPDLATSDPSSPSIVRAVVVRCVERSSPPVASATSPAQQNLGA